LFSPLENSTHKEIGDLLIIHLKKQPLFFVRWVFFFGWGFLGGLFDDNVRIGFLFAFVVDIGFEDDRVFFRAAVLCAHFLLFCIMQNIRNSCNALHHGKSVRAMLQF